MEGLQDINCRPANRPAFGGTVPLFYQMSRVPLNLVRSQCYSVFWNAIDFCRLYTSKKISMRALPTVPLFAGKSRFFTRNVPLKTFSRLAGLKLVTTLCIRPSNGWNLTTTKDDIELKANSITSLMQNLRRSGFKRNLRMFPRFR